MKLLLSVISGPHLGKEFSFDSHDTFLVGRDDDAHLRLSYDDPYFSRRHFVVEINPPRCRVLDLKSRNGTLVNGRRIEVAEIRHGDEIAAGHTIFKATIIAPEVQDQPTLKLDDQPIAKRPEPTLDLPGEQPLQLPGYEIVDEIGRGGMGVVYKAIRQSNQQVVAIKTITPAVGVSHRQISRFVRECRILGQLSHPNIVAFHEVGEADGIVFLVMEMVGGPDLDKVVTERGPLAVKTAVRVLCQMLAGLSQAHVRGFVHRDIKPSNILISSKPGNRIAKLADFGLARVYESSKMSGLTMQGEIGGTPAYMAPEQVTHYRDVKPAADQYSAAAALYKLLTGQTPHNLPTDVAIQLIHLVTEAPVPIRQRRQDIPEALAEVIHKALSMDPKKRFPSVSAFRKSLLEFT